jgi:dTDP-4-amino-4,6-dideoxygalactose transaminase
MFRTNLYTQNKIIEYDFYKNLRNIFKNSEFIKGRYNDIFEKRFKKKLNINYSLACANGTDALFLAISSLNLKKNSEIIVPSHTWISTASSVINAGHKVIFCDTKKNDFNICFESLKKKINFNTKAVIVVHLYGNPCDILKIRRLCKEKKIFLIEDCAQAHFVKFKNKYCGTFGDISTFSFFPTKNLGGFGDGGMVVTNSKKLFIKTQMLANHGGIKKNQHVIIGINSRMDNIQALGLNLKLNYIKKFITERRKSAKFYCDLFKEKKMNIFFQDPKKNPNHSYHQFVIMVDKKKRNKLKNFLNQNNVEANIHYPSILPLVPAFKNFNNKSNNFKNSHENQKKILSLPIYPYQNYNEILKIVNLINKFLKLE